MSKSIMLRSNPVKTLATGETTSNIDHENGIIKNAVLVMATEAKGHDVHLSDDFTKSIYDLGIKSGERGLKSRFGHPNSSARDSLGTYVGQYHNFSYHEATEKTPSHVKADLHLAESAKISPEGNMYDYILKLASENDGQNFSNSIVFSEDLYHFEDKQGNILADGEQYEISGAKRVLDSAKMLYAIDLVDEGAATDSLFCNPKSFAKRATEFLDQNSDIMAFIMDTESDEAITKFMKKYFSNRPDMAEKFTASPEANTKQKSREKTMENEEKENMFTRMFTACFGKGEEAPEVKPNEVIEKTPEVIELKETPEFTALAAEKIELQTKIEELQCKLDEAPEEKPDHFTALAELEGERLTPAARKNAIKAMSEGTYEKESFLASADRISEKIDLKEDNQVDHKAEFSALKGKEKTAYFKKFEKEILSA